MSDTNFEITIVVNGQPVGIKVGPDDEIGEAVADALKASGNSGQSAERWELRDESGQPIDTGKKIRESAIAAGAKLFLNLKAGVGGGSV
ncbi:MAG: DUF2604 domain-containing protein [Bryobacterales bacterium]|nr:DUF2604 domain-containing protein [Bryobacterales bacterium]